MPCWESGPVETAVPTLPVYVFEHSLKPRCPKAIPKDAGFTKWADAATSAALIKELFKMGPV